MNMHTRLDRHLPDYPDDNDLRFFGCWFALGLVVAWWSLIIWIAARFIFT